MAQAEPELRRYNIWQFAELVKSLRMIQKSSGKGYKTTTANKAAMELGKKVDAAIRWIERHPFG